MDWKPRWWHWAIGALALGVFLAAAFLIPPLLVHEPKLHEPEEAQALADYRANVLQIFTGLAVLGAGIFTWWRIQIAQQQVRVAEEGQITERYSRAIDQLGEEDEKGGRRRLDVRIGGVYALERIAADAQARAIQRAGIARDHLTVVEVLCTFVRTHIGEARPADEEVERWIPYPDVEAALTVLGRQNLPARLEKLVSPHVDLTRAKLRLADLTGADLTGADLTGANLTGADLTDADLTDADLDGASFSLAILTRARITGADLTGADLTGADLTGADLRGADLTRANLTGANLRLAPVTDLTFAPLTEADLANADLTNANLTEADLTNADLTEADLTNADLTNADLTGTDLTNADLRGALFTGSTFDEMTRWPDDFEPPAS